MLRFQALAMNKTQTAQQGKLVTYQLSATVVDISGEVRKQLRPDDKELVGEQLSYSEETLLIGSPHADPLFAGQLLGLHVGDIRSFEYTYPDYDRDNFLSLPVDFLVANRVPEAKLQVGYILNRDILRGKVAIGGNATELEIIEIKKVGGRKFVVLDSNDPLRGMTIRYDCEVLEIRDPTSEEVAADSL